MAPRPGGSGEAGRATASGGPSQGPRHCRRGGAEGPRPAAKPEVPRPPRARGTTPRPDARADLGEPDCASGWARGPNFCPRPAAPVRDPPPSWAPRGTPHASPGVPCFLFGPSLLASPGLFKALPWSLGPYPSSALFEFLHRGPQFLPPGRPGPFPPLPCFFSAPPPWSLPHWSPTSMVPNPGARARPLSPFTGSLGPLLSLRAPDPRKGSPREGAPDPPGREWTTRRGRPTPYTPQGRRGRETPGAPEPETRTRS